MLAHDRHDPAMAAWASQWEARLAAGIGRGELLAELRRAPASHVFREWTVANDSVMQDVIRSAGAEAARNYLQGQPVKFDAPDQMIHNTPFSR
ncbi:hypothetical protein [Pseudoduganella ginsengisoli]|nr:hypothetical protein [Pseudoduganella ginsengisoli]